MRRNIQIVHVSISPSSGGGIAQLVRFYSRLLPNFKHVASCSDSSSLIMKILYLLSAVIILFYQRVVRGCKVFHFHGASYNSFRRKLLLARIVKCLGARTIYHLHAGDFTGFHKILGTEYIVKSFRSYDAIIVLSEYWKKYIETNFNYNRIYVINNVVDYPSISKERKINDGKFTLLYMGALYEDKGIYDLLSLLYNEKTYYESCVRLHICGGRTRQEVSKLSKKIKEYNLSNIVFFHGYVEGDAKSRLFNDCDALILPSYYEGLPMCILEAMSYAKPVIATSVGSIPEIVTHTVNGYLFNSGDIMDMNKCIKSIISLPDKGRRMGEAGRLRVTSFYPETVRRDLLNMYQHFIQEVCHL